MNLIEIDENGRIHLHVLDSLRVIKDWLTRPSGLCVVCTGKTRQMYANGVTGELDYVHSPSEPDSIGCKEVWRYWQDRDEMTTRTEWLDKYSEEYATGYYDIRDIEDYEFLDERDFWDDYKSYIASREWEIKSCAVKQSVGWRCEKCGRGGNKTTLHAHHKHYRTLYKEQRKDISILCRDCHNRAHHW